MNENGGFHWDDFDIPEIRYILVVVFGVMSVYIIYWKQCPAVGWIQSFVFLHWLLIACNVFKKTSDPLLSSCGLNWTKASSLVPSGTSNIGFAWGMGMFGFSGFDSRVASQIQMLIVSKKLDFFAVGDILENAIFWMFRNPASTSWGW